MDDTTQSNVTRVPGQQFPDYIDALLATLERQLDACHAGLRRWVAYFWRVRGADTVRLPNGTIAISTARRKGRGGRTNTIPRVRDAAVQSMLDGRLGEAVLTSNRLAAAAKRHGTPLPPASIVASEVVVRQALDLLRPPFVPAGGAELWGLPDEAALAAWHDAQHDVVEALRLWASDLPRLKALGRGKYSATDIAKILNAPLARTIKRLQRFEPNDPDDWDKVQDPCQWGSRTRYRLDAVRELVTRPDHQRAVQPADGAPPRRVRR